MLILAKAKNLYVYFPNALNDYILIIMEFFYQDSIVFSWHKYCLHYLPYRFVPLKQDWYFGTLISKKTNHLSFIQNIMEIWLKSTNVLETYRSNRKRWLETSEECFLWIGGENENYFLKENLLKDWKNEYLPLFDI